MPDDVKLTASTGQADSGGIWGTLLRSATDIGKSYLQPNNRPAPPVTPAAPAPAAVSTNWKQYLPYAIGAVVLLVVVGLVFRKR